MSYRLIIIFVMLTIGMAAISAFSPDPPEKKAPPVMAEMAGTLVSIPKAYAGFVEFDDSSAAPWGRYGLAAREGPWPRLKGFGFDAHFPDMAVAERYGDKQGAAWLRVSVTVHAVDDGILERHRKNYLDARRTCAAEETCFMYRLLPAKTHGLIAYSPVGPGIDMQAREAGGPANYRDRNMYVHEDGRGMAKTLIMCSNKSRRAAMCQQFFELGPLPGAQVDVVYQKDLLPHWQEIQSALITLLQGFQARRPVP